MLISVHQRYDANDFDRFYRSLLSKCDTCKRFGYSILYFSNASDILILNSSSLKAYLIHHS